MHLFKTFLTAFTVIIVLGALLYLAGFTAIWFLEFLLSSTVASWIKFSVVLVIVAIGGALYVTTIEGEYVRYSK